MQEDQHLTQDLYGNNMKLCNLASGSTGNSTYVETKNYKILLDVGKTKKYLTEKLAAIGVNANDIDYVFLTHTHDDHISALKTFLKGHKATLVVTKEMFMQLHDLEGIEHVLIYDDNPEIEGLDIKSYRMSHDAGDTRAFLITEDNSSLVYITDTGYVNSRYFNELKGKTAYYIECNHDIELLRHGPYPVWLQKRVLSDVGHLSNKFTGMYLSKLIDEGTSHILLMHLSEKNNKEEVALNTVYEELKDIDISNIKIACAKPNNESEVVII